MVRIYCSSSFVDSMVLEAQFSWRRPGFVVPGIEIIP